MTLSPSVTEAADHGVAPTRKRPASLSTIYTHLLPIKGKRIASRERRRRREDHAPGRRARGEEDQCPASALCRTAVPDYHRWPASLGLRWSSAGRRTSRSSIRPWPRGEYPYCEHSTVEPEVGGKPARNTACGAGVHDGGDDTCAPQRRGGNGTVLYTGRTMHVQYAHFSSFSVSLLSGRVPHRRRHTQGGGPHAPTSLKAIAWRSTSTWRP